ncbi:MAG: Eco57I restriction-modification methylase domain-containing protein [Chitinophagales bacterium]
MVIENRIYQAYYTESTPIVNYMVRLLKLRGGESILEPCAGDGIFVDAVMKAAEKVEVEAFELNEAAFYDLSEKYEDCENIRIKQTDTLTDIDLELQSLMGGKYDAVIANPPYGAWRTTEERKQLKKRYNGWYAKESYSLFLYRSIEALKESGRLVFIIPDTYLNLHNHKDIRKYLLTKTKIQEIALFPSAYFPGVNFGYANLSIIALEKCKNRKECLDNGFKIIKGFHSVEELGEEGLEHTTTLNLKQSDVLKNSNSAFLMNINPKINACLRETKTTIGDICDCVTGFYSGNDKEFLKVRNKEIRNSKRYEMVDLDKVEFDCSPVLCNGIEGEKEFVPIVKGGNTKYFKPDNWFMEWSVERVDFYKKNKKARYQNPAFYFRKGIAVPMVSSKSITGALIENRLFDQSIVGVFPKKGQEKWLYFLLAFFNSPTCNQLIRTLNPSTNNSANYLKKIPFLLPDGEELERIEENVRKILEGVKEKGEYDVSLEEDNHRMIQQFYGF